MVVASITVVVAPIFVVEAPITVITEAPLLHLIPLFYQGQQYINDETDRTSWYN